MRTRTEIITEIERLMSELAALDCKPSQASETQAAPMQAGIMPISDSQRKLLYAQRGAVEMKTIQDWEYLQLQAGKKAQYCLGQIEGIIEYHKDKDDQTKIKLIINCINKFNNAH